MGIVYKERLRPLIFKRKKKGETFRKRTNETIVATNLTLMMLVDSQSLQTILIKFKIRHSILCRY